MSSSEASVQKLLLAEQQASKIVQDARNKRKEKLKQAKDEAKKEAEVFRGQKLSEFTKFKEIHITGTSQQQEELSKKTATEIAGIKKSLAANCDAVVELLMKAVTTIDDPFDGLQE